MKRGRYAHRLTYREGDQILKNMARHFQQLTNYTPPGGTIFVLAGTRAEMDAWAAKRHFDQKKLVFVDRISRMTGCSGNDLYCVGTFWKRSDSEPILETARKHRFRIRREEE